MHCVHIDGHGHGLCDQPVLRGIAEGIHGAHHGRYVPARFPRQVLVHVPEIGFSAGPLNGFVHIPGAAVIGRYGQRPVLENAVGVPQIAGGGIYRQYGIHALIDKRIDPESVAFGGTIHKLPLAQSAHTGLCPRIERTLNHGQILQFFRKVVAAESFLVDGHIILRQAHHLSHLPGHLLRIKNHVILYRLIVGERNERIHGRQPPHEHRIRDIRGKTHGIHIVLFPGR